MIAGNLKIVGRLLLLFFVVQIQQVQAQNKNFYPWLMPGISVKLAKKTSLLTQLGYTPTQNSLFIYILGFYQMNKHMALQAGYFGFSSETGRNVYRENDFIVAGTYHRNWARFTLEDRNMFLGIIPSQGANQLYYRNRFRLLSPNLLDPIRLRLYGLGEGYYSFSDKRFTRSRIGAGITMEASENILLDVSYLHQEDPYLNPRSLIFLQITAKLN